MEDERSRSIRQKAYEIWERKGRPHGRAEEHWLEAEGSFEAKGEPSQKASVQGAGDPSGSEKGQETAKVTDAPKRAVGKRAVAKTAPANKAPAKKASAKKTGAKSSVLDS